MANGRKSNRLEKPLIFLSHSSSNRRELIRLKRLLDERSGGMIDFFLSSDDESIDPGTIWPAEVRAALDRMTLMLIFVSADALKSGWTYFEAGYGLHKLNSANIYCLPGTDKAKLPPPFNITQNRNLHCASDLSLLIRQCNTTFGAKISETISKEEFEAVFKPAASQVAIGPAFCDLAASISGQAICPPNGRELFEAACAEMGMKCTKISGRGSLPVIGRGGEWCSTGIKFFVEEVSHLALKREIKITEEDRKAGNIDTSRLPSEAFRDARFEDLMPDWDSIPINDAESYNQEMRQYNEEVHRVNLEKEMEDRVCGFTLATSNLAIPIGILDTWLNLAEQNSIESLTIECTPAVSLEHRHEAIAAQIHGTSLSLYKGSLLSWLDRAAVELRTTSRACIEVTPFEDYKKSVSALEIENLVTTLLKLGVLSLEQRRRTRYK